MRPPRPSYRDGRRATNVGRIDGRPSARHGRSTGSDGIYPAFTARMDPIGALAAAVLLGTVLGPVASVPWWAWGLLACGASLVAGSRFHLGTLPTSGLGSARP